MMIDWILENAAIAFILLGVVRLLTRTARLRPAVEHALWLVVLIRLVMPPLVDWPWSLPLAPGPAPGDEAAGEATVPSRATPAPSPSAAPREESEPRLVVPLPPKPSEPATALAAGRESARRSDRAFQKPVLEEAGRDGGGSPTHGDAAARRRSGSWIDRDGGVTVARLEDGGHRESARLESPPPMETVTRLTPPESAEETAPRKPSDAVSTTAEPASPRAAVLTALPSLREAATGAWLLGALVVLLLHAVRAIRFQRSLRDDRRPPAWLARETRALAASIGVPPPRLVVVPKRRSPAIWALGRPALVIPAALLERLERGAWQGVLLHELAHLRRRDHWVGWVVLAADALHWWNPVHHLVRRRLRASAELACDAWVVEALPGERRGYAESLIDISAFASPAREPAPAIGISSGTRKTYERRLRMILESHHGARLPLGGLVAAAVLTLAALPGWSQGEPEPAGEPPAGDDVFLDEAADSAELDDLFVEGADEEGVSDLLDDPGEASSGADLFEDGGEDGATLDAGDPLEEGSEDGAALDGGEDERPLDAAEEKRSPFRRFLEDRNVPVREIERTLRETLEDTRKEIGRLEKRLDALMEDPRVRKVERKLEEGLHETRRQLEHLGMKLRDVMDDPRVQKLERDGKRVLRDVLEDLKSSLEDVIEELEPDEGRPERRPRASDRPVGPPHEGGSRRRGTGDLFGPHDPNWVRSRREGGDLFGPREPNRDPFRSRRKSGDLFGPRDPSIDPRARRNRADSPSPPAPPAKPKEPTLDAERALKVYGLPNEKAKALADFLREHAAEDLEVAVRGNQLIVAGPERIHRQIEALIELIAPERKARRRAPRESEVPAPDVKPAQ